MKGVLFKLKYYLKCDYLGTNPLDLVVPLASAPARVGQLVDWPTQETPKSVWRLNELQGDARAAAPFGPVARSDTLS